MQNSPIACNMAALTATQRARREALWQSLQRHIQHISEIDNGFSLQFSPVLEIIVAIAEFVSLERLCCPFLHFHIEIESEGGRVRLHIGGREGVKSFLKSELAIGKSVKKIS